MISLTIKDPRLVAHLSKVARRRRISRSAVVSQMLVQALEDDEDRRTAALYLKKPGRLVSSANIRRRVGL